MDLRWRRGTGAGTAGGGDRRLGHGTDCPAGARPPSVSCGADHRFVGRACGPAAGVRPADCRGRARARPPPCWPTAGCGCSCGRSARSVGIKYVVAGGSSRSMTVRVRGGAARVTLPASATSIRVRGPATSTRRATAWTRVPIASSSPAGPAALPGDDRRMGGRAARTGQRGASLGPHLPRRRAPWTQPRRWSAIPRWMRRPAATPPGWPRSAGSRTRDAAARPWEHGSPPSGYAWHRAAENVAAGRPRPAETLAQWLGSSGHCRELMNPASTRDRDRVRLLDGLGLPALLDPGLRHALTGGAWAPSRGLALPAPG